jgi:acyl carrier protein
MMSVEDTFHIEEIDEEELQSMKTVGDVVNYISDRI